MALRLPRVMLQFESLGTVPVFSTGGDCSAFMGPSASCDCFEFVHPCACLKGSVSRRRSASCLLPLIGSPDMPHDLLSQELFC